MLCPRLLADDAQSILMYASGPVDIHIICDADAQTYLEARLALVTQPKYDFLVRFYRPRFEDMAARVEREGAISTIHSAGVVGLMKLFIHELLPPSVPRAIFVDTDAFFISDPLLLWRQFAAFDAHTAIAMPSHPDQSSAVWRDANKVCSCVMLLDLARLRALRLMASTLYTDGPALAPPLFAALFGPPAPKYADVWLGDQSFWWAIVRARPDLYAHLPYDFEVSSCLYDMYVTGLGEPDATAAEQVVRQQDRVRGTPSEGVAVVPRLLHLCVPSLARGRCVRLTARAATASRWTTTLTGPAGTTRTTASTSAGARPSATTRATSGRGSTRATAASRSRPFRMCSSRTCCMRRRTNSSNEILEDVFIVLMARVTERG